MGGFLLYSCFVLYGFVYPVYTRLGCCGKCKPKESETKENLDHIAEAQEDFEISQVELDRIREIVREEMARNNERQNQQMHQLKPNGMSVNGGDMPNKDMPNDDMDGGNYNEDMDNGKNGSIQPGIQAGIQPNDYNNVELADMNK